jgi:hypothetical protein
MTKPCKRCTCQRLGYVRPACVRGLTGWLDADGQRRFDALACDLDSRLFAAPVPAPPPTPARYRQGKRCVDCGCPIVNNAKSRCRVHAAKANGAKHKGGPRNEAWARRSRFPRSCLARSRKIVAKRRAR